MAGFTVLETPGHSRGHVAYWRESDRVLILGDVLNSMNVLTGVRGLHEPPAIFTPDPPRNRDSARRLAALEPALDVLRPRRRPLRDPGKLTDFVVAAARLSDAMSDSIFVRRRRALHPDRARPRAVGSRGAPRRRARGADRRPRSSGCSPARSSPIARLGFEFLRPIPFAPLDAVDARRARRQARAGARRASCTPARSSSAARARCACRRSRRTCRRRRPAGIWRDGAARARRRCPRPSPASAVRFALDDSDRAGLRPDRDGDALA